MGNGMERNSKISVILPVYNNKTTIEQCMLSVQNQTYQNFELFIVDDGSEDGSYEICSRYAKEDNRIRLERLQHQGVAKTRNYALARAQGAYVMFIDGDDRYHPCMLEKMLAAIKKDKVDLAVCRYKKMMEGYTLPCTIWELRKIYTTEEYLKNTLSDPGHHYYGVVWNKIYSMELIRTYGLCFDEKAGLGEDFIFNLAYFPYTRRVKVIGDVLYYYNCREVHSLSRPGEDELATVQYELQSRKQIFRSYKECFQRYHLYETYQKQINHYWVAFYIRQKYYLKYKYTNWQKKDKDTLSRLLEQDETIKESLNYVSRWKLRREQFYFFVQYRCKAGIKYLLPKFK